MIYLFCLFSIDAAQEDGSFGRLVNDEHIHPNCRMKKVVIDGKPYLCLFALRDIIPGEEITYNYGEAHWPWRKKVSQTKHTIFLSGAIVINN